MRSAFKLILLSFLGLSLSFCSTFSKDEEAAKDDIPKYDNYHSSGVYNDIESEGRSVSTEDYSDDDYGSLDENESENQDEEIILGAAHEPEPEAETDPLPLKNEEPLPVEKLEPVKKKMAKKKRARTGQAFKNGMYRVSVNCTMRSKPSTKAKGVGKVRKGKKLWMEKHNKNWVKIFKKSGPVYINKLCL